MPAQNLTVTAQWDVDQYTMTFLSEGQVHATLTQPYGSTVVAPVAPIRGGYIFDGWNPDIPAVMPARDSEYDAKWILDPTPGYTVNQDGSVTIDDDVLDSAVAPVTVMFGTASVTLTVETCDDLDDIGDVDVILKPVVSEQVTPEMIAAIGTNPAYTVTISSGGNPITQFPRGIIILLPYVPSDGEDVSLLRVVHVAEDGTTDVVGGQYDAEKGGMVFSIDHLSTS